MVTKQHEGTALDRLRQLEAERSRLDAEAARIRSEAAEELLQTARAALAEANEFGFNYEIVQKGRRMPGAAEVSRKGTRQVNASRPCPICDFATVPPHDARRHRGQDPKRPFTAAELADVGMSRAG